MKLEMFHCQPQRSGGAAHHPILFVHGSYCGAWVWAEKWMPYFAEQGFASHAVSLRGHGASEGEVSTASLEDYLGDVETAIDTIGEPLVLVGHSMGGLVVQHLIGRNRETVHGAVLASSVPPSGLASSAAHLAAFASDVLWQLGVLQAEGTNAVSGPVLHRALFSPDSPPEAVAPMMAGLQKESDRIGVELMTPPWPLIPLGPDRPPVLVIGGDADLFLPTFAFHETRLAFSGDLAILKGAPHGLMLDPLWWQPSADHIIDWLRTKAL